LSVFKALKYYNPFKEPREERPMKVNQKVLFVDASTGYYRIRRYPVGDFFGPVDLGLHLAAHYNTLNIGVGLLAGSIFPGSNRLIFSGFSPSWTGFYISSMGGAGLVFENMGINMVSIAGKAAAPSLLYLNRVHSEEIIVEIVPIDLNQIWKDGRGGIYSTMDYAYNLFGENYENDPRILAVGPASQSTDFGAIGSAPITKGRITHVDTWAGRGGLGTKMLRQHGIAAIIYGGTYLYDDFRDRKVADKWFENKYDEKLMAKDFESTTKYRFDPKFDTGGTFGVNFASLAGRIILFNYSSIYMDEAERVEIHKRFILDHYLRQFNEETIRPKLQKTCGEPCTAVCKKMHNEFKKDYEPYQTMGPLCGVFDQRAAEKINHRADTYGFDAISVGGVLSWLMECMAKGLIKPQELGVNTTPLFSHKGFNLESDSMHNADLGAELMDSIIEKRGVLDLQGGARKMARRLARERGKEVLDLFLYNAFGRNGWMVPNQYWTPGVLSPMAIMGKYYMYYGEGFLPPRELGRKNAERFRKELTLDNLGICRFHREWAEDMVPEIMESLYGLRDQFLEKIAMTASRVNSRNSSVFWESERNFDYIYTFLKRRNIVEGDSDPELLKWIDLFEKDKREAGLSFWYEIHKGIHESLREF
jgi:glyceraldehyde-3-phosphate dehydrogenase (ferredoxin)